MLKIVSMYSKVTHLYVYQVWFSKVKRFSKYELAECDAQSHFEGRSDFVCRSTPYNIFRYLLWPN